MRKLYILILLIITGLFRLSAQVDREFWFVAPHIGPNHAGNQTVLFCITAMDIDAVVTLNFAGVTFSDGSHDTIINVPAGTSNRLTINSAVANPFFTMNGTPAYTSNNFLNFKNEILPNKILFQQPLNRGIHIQSTADITVYYDIAGGWNMDLYALKGKNALGSEFYCPFQTKWPWKRASDIQASSQIDIVSADDNNEIYIVVTCTTSLWANCNVTNALFPAVSPIVNYPGDTIKITLNQGQTYSIRNWRKTEPGALGGTHIWTKDPTKKIAVTITDDSAQSSCGGCADIIGDQLVPVNICGNKYIVMRSKLTAACDGWYFVGIMYDNTTITLNDGTGPVIAGTFNKSLIPSEAVRQFQIPAGKEYVYVESTQPVIILHVAGFGCEVGGAILPPITNCTGSTEVSFYRLNRANDAFFINLMTRHGAQYGFKLITECGDTVAIPSTWFQFIPGSGDTISVSSINRGWWVIKDQFKQFGCTGVAPGECMNGASQYKGTCNIDGDNTGNATKNNIGVIVNKVTKIINTIDFFHLGVYGGGVASTNQYGYFSAFNSSMGIVETVETGSSNTRLCYKDTLTLHATGGLSYEWWYNPSGLLPTPPIVGDTIKKYLEPGKDKKSVCKAYGFTMPPGDTIGIFNFRVRIKRSVCFGDTTPLVKVQMLAPIFPKIVFSKTQLCSDDSVTITNNSTGGDKTRYIWQYKDNYSTPGFTDMTVNPVWNPSFKYNFRIPYDSTKLKTVTIRFYAQKEHCEEQVLQDLLVYPTVKASFKASPLWSCNPANITFTDSSKGVTMNQRIWTFGDGGSAFTQNATHSYFNPQTNKDTIYNGNLLVKNDYCQSDSSFTIKVFRQVRSSFSVDTPFICSPIAPDTTYKLVKVGVNNNAMGGTVSWKFRLGNKEIGTSACSQTHCDFMFPVNLSGVPRVYTIVQYVKYNPGTPNLDCIDSSKKTITIYPAIKADFTVNDSLGCSPKAIEFTKPVNNAAVTLFWEFGDGNSSIDSANKITHLYKNLTGTDAVYSSRLIVQSNSLCRDTFTLNIRIAEEVHAYFSVDTSKGCAPLHVTITNGSTEYRNACEWSVSYPSILADTTTTKNAVFKRTFDNTTSLPIINNYRLIVKNDNPAPLSGCPDTMIIPIRIYPKVESQYTTSTDPGNVVCQPYPILFTNNTSTVIANMFNWNFGDGTSSSSTDTVTHVYVNLTGKDTTFISSLISYTQYGCIDTLKKNITVGAYIDADFKINTAAGCSPLTVSITNTSRQYSAISKYSWDMGNGVKMTKTDTLPISYIYTNKGNIDSARNLKLVVEHTVSGTTCKDSLIKPIIVYPEVHPSFTVSASSGCTPLSVTFVNKTNAAATKFNWDFGDGTGYTGRDTSHTFTNTTYNDLTRTVKLQAESDHKCASDSSMNIIIYGLFNVDFNITKNNVCAGLPVGITMNTTGTQIAFYAWDVDNNGTYDISNPAASQPASFNYIYPQMDILKNYNLTVYAQSTHGCKDTAVHTATVYPRIIADFVVQKQPGIDDSTECSPFNTIMKNLSVNAASYDWTFWDGTTSAQTSPTPVFTNLYHFDIKRQVTLVATSAYNCKDTMIKNAIIYHKPVVNFESAPSAGCSPLPVTFKNNSLTSKSTYYWDFKDGSPLTTTTTNQDVSHTFTTSITSAGSDEQYIVKLKAVTDTGLCTDSSTQNIFVHPRVIAAFNVDTANCAPYSAVFQNLSENTAVTFSWNFGDTYSSVAQNPIHLYPDNGDYTVSLTGRSVNGCTHSVTKTIHVYSQPTADFLTIPMMQIYPSSTVSLENKSVGNGTFNYYWNVDVGGANTTYTKTDKSTFTHTYAWWGDKTKNYKYYIQLIVSNNQCADTLLQDIEVRPAVPIAGFDPLFSSCPPVTIQFNNTSIYATSYEWNFGDGITSSDFNPTHTYDTAGLYTITLYAYGEGGAGSFYRNLRLFDVPIADFKLEPLDPMLPNAVIKCSNGSKYAVQYFWNFGDDEQWIPDLNPKHQYYRLGSYWVTLRVISDSGCTDTMKYPEPVIVDGPGKIVFPNAFTPNPNGSSSGGKYSATDQTNDIFFPYHDGVVDYHLEIYNRWGELMFTSTDVYVGWDGYYKGSLCKQDVYVYKCSGSFLNGKKFSKSGDITLLIKQ